MAPVAPVAVCQQLLSLAGLPGFSLSGVYAFPGWCSPSQTLQLLMIPISAVLPYLSTASLTALQCHSSAASEQPGTGQCHGDMPEPGQEHMVRAHGECSRGELAVGLGREKLIKVYLRVSQSQR